ncbi:Protein FAM86A, putative [Perkinsus marinus ATCC 50983]|uniref:Protein FAM86A, putative n=1 Tax=Perkinsus marinus (strain ATCC 50983 / TXsc) TaxID=423536 RepID=C5LZW3_PERM5|nr:Protein FAM86A, putative [Perkinsus marinus ATCC 50983]EEQ97781.1 Protein FAM86A, putative [Perkinsus marinus ATCC 50983]|eukprot:XP_002765064.1 Protein FAM86A, putative [Perkinsus marinus ATCC 50983]
MASAAPEGVSLFPLPRYYFSLYPVGSIPWALLLVPYVTWEAQEALIDETIYADLTCSPPLKYSVAFVKRLVTELGRITDEVHDLWYEFIAQNNAELNTPESERGFIAYRVGDSSISLGYDVSGRFIEQGTTGLSQWEAGRYLASWLVANKCAVEGKDVLELGSGSGLVGLVAAGFSAARRVVLTDGNALVVKALRANVKSNKLDNVEVAELNWDDQSRSDLLESAEVLLGADLTYDPTIVGALMATIRRMRRDAVCYLCSAVRTDSTWREFLKLLDGLDVKVLVPGPAQWEGLVREEFLAGRCPRPKDLDMDIVLLEIRPRASCDIVTNEIDFAIGA